MNVQISDMLHQVKEWANHVPWSQLYHQTKDGNEFAMNVFEFFLIARKNDKQDLQLPPQNPTPPYPYTPSSRRRNPKTRYLNRSLRKRKSSPFQGMLVFPF